MALACNIAKDEDRKRFAAELGQQVKSINVMINNAGALWAAPIAEYPESGWDKVFDLNVKGTFFLVKELLPLLEAGGSAEDPARIINVGSIDAFHIPQHETYAYSASKAALHQLTKHLAAQLAPRHIAANVIAPGMFPSKMLAGTLEKQGPGKHGRAHSPEAAHQRLGHGRRRHLPRLQGRLLRDRRRGAGGRGIRHHALNPLPAGVRGPVDGIQQESTWKNWTFPWPPMDPTV